MRSRTLRPLSSAAVAVVLSLVGASGDQPTSFVRLAYANTTVTQPTLDNICTQKRDRKDVYVRAVTTQPNQLCHLTITYADGKSDSPDDVTSDADRVCILHFDVPDRKGVVGKARAKLQVTAGQGSPIGTARGSFTVKEKAKK
jgi:hypothetical protein